MPESSLYFRTASDDNESVLRARLKKIQGNCRRPGAPKSISASVEERVKVLVSPELQELDSRITKLETHLKEKPRRVAADATSVDETLRLHKEECDAAMKRLNDEVGTLREENETLRQENKTAAQAMTAIKSELRDLRSTFEESLRREAASVIQQQSNAPQQRLPGLSGQRRRGNEPAPRPASTARGQSEAQGTSTPRFVQSPTSTSRSSKRGNRAGTHSSASTASKSKTRGRRPGFSKAQQRGVQPSGTNASRVNPTRRSPGVVDFLDTPTPRGVRQIASTDSRPNETGRRRTSKKSKKPTGQPSSPTDSLANQDTIGSPVAEENQITVQDILDNPVTEAFLEVRTGSHLDFLEVNRVARDQTRVMVNAEKMQIWACQSCSECREDVTKAFVVGWNAENEGVSPGWADYSKPPLTWNARDKLNKHLAEMERQGKVVAYPVFSPQSKKRTPRRQRRKRRNG